MTPLYTSRIRNMKHPSAYIAGLIAADGSLEVRQPFITLSSADRNFLEKYARLYLEAATNRRVKIFEDKSAKVFKLRLHDRQFWKRLTGKYNVPAGAKSKKIKPPLKLTSNEEVSYIQGWFDGEGWLETLHVRSKVQHEYPRIGFKIRSEPVRDWIVEAIRKRGIRVKPYDRSEGTFGFWINGIVQCERFRRRLGFGYSKKNEALEQLVTKCRGQVSTQIRPDLR